MISILFIFTGRENQLKEQIKVFIYILLQSCVLFFFLNLTYLTGQPICIHAFQHFNKLKYTHLVPYKLWSKNNSQTPIEETRALSKITQVEGVNSLQQWFLFNNVTSFTLSNYIQTIPQSYYKCKNVKNVHKHIHKPLFLSELTHY